LSKILKISTASISIAAGHKSKEKTLVILGKSALEIKQVLFP